MMFNRPSDSSFSGHPLNRLVWFLECRIRIDFNNDLNNDLDFGSCFKDALLPLLSVTTFSMRVSR